MISLRVSSPARVCGDNSHTNSWPTQTKKTEKARRDIRPLERANLVTLDPCPWLGGGLFVFFRRHHCSPFLCLLPTQPESSCVSSLGSCILPPRRTTHSRVSVTTTERSVRGCQARQRRDHFVQTSPRDVRLRPNRDRDRSDHPQTPRYVQTRWNLISPSTRGNRAAKKRDIPRRLFAQRDEESVRGKSMGFCLVCFSFRTSRLPSGCSPFSSYPKRSSNESKAPYSPWMSPG